jgi:hypothetical protein
MRDFPRIDVDRRENDRDIRFILGNRASKLSKEEKIHIADKTN